MLAMSKCVIPRSKERRISARLFEKSSAPPKLCQSPSEISGSLRPLRPHLRYRAGFS